jgi:hypothetical protein
LKLPLRAGPEGNKRAWIGLFLSNYKARLGQGFLLIKIKEPTLEHHYLLCM